MDIAGILSQVDGERIYRHVLTLEGTRHPIDAPERLNEAADYIFAEFKQYGLEAAMQTFQVEGFGGVFKNVEATIRNGDEDSPELLIVSHYDTVENCPGADDNASAVAVMLETARVLAKTEDVHNVRFISFTLEELNPAYESKARSLAKSLGLKDSRNRYTSMRGHLVMKKFLELQRKYWRMGKNVSEAFAEARNQMHDQMSEAELGYAQGLEELCKGMTSWVGKTGDVGSAIWVEEAIRARKKFLGVLCFDTIGYTSDKEHSQTLPAGIDPKVLQTQGAEDATIGNFLAVVGNVNSSKLIQTLFAQSSLNSIELPSAYLQIPFTYEQMDLNMPDLLRSDHAPFWQNGIPGLFLTDTGDFRYPYYHTPADTIERLNFDFLTRICKATIATAIQTTAN